jgi:peptidoglycan/xylan/chitin deacetylase (PgdA/CDA1 family)
LALLLSLYSFQVSATPAKTLAAAPLALAEQAVAQIEQQQYREAARTAQRALQTTPDDPTLHALAGTLLLSSGDTKAALTAFGNATACGGNDSLAYYGRGLAQLACGDRAAALSDFQRSERAGGDKGCLFLAQRYTQWLNGVQLRLDGASMPDDLMPSLDALQGMVATRRGDTQRAISALRAAVETPDGSVLLQSSGILMTFDPARPLDSAAPPLQETQGLTPRLTHDHTVSGSVFLTPQGLTPSVAYVSYEVDGQALSLVNVRPFQYTWDTQSAPNGWHELAFILYDADGREISRGTQRIHTYNAGVSAWPSGSRDQVERLRAALWQMLTLRPDRCACNYTLGAAYRTLADSADARKWFACAAAIQPDYRDTRRQLAQLGGLGAGGAAVFGGLPTEKVVALTFDDGPKPGVTEALLDVLVRNQVPATFFVVGRQAMLYPDLTRQIAAAGMEIANHSYTHPNLTTLPAAALAREILRTQAVVETLTGKTPRYLRPPGGDWNGDVAKIVRQWGLTPCFWTVDAYSAEVVGAQQVADAVLTQVRPGSIVLMHNGKMSTIQALPTIIRTLRAHGYTFATVDMLVRRLAAVRESARAAPINTLPPGRRSE